MGLMEGKRISLMIPESMESKLYELRNREEFKRLSISEIVRRLIEIGIASIENKEGTHEHRG